MKKHAEKIQRSIRERTRVDLNISRTQITKAILKWGSLHDSLQSRNAFGCTSRKGTWDGQLEFRCWEGSEKYVWFWDPNSSSACGALSTWQSTQTRSEKNPWKIIWESRRRSLIGKLMTMISRCACSKSWNSSFFKAFERCHWEGDSNQTTRSRTRWYANQSSDLHLAWLPEKHLWATLLSSLTSPLNCSSAEVAWFSLDTNQRNFWSRRTDDKESQFMQHQSWWSWRFANSLGLLPEIEGAISIFYLFGLPPPLEHM